MQSSRFVAATTTTACKRRRRCPPVSLASHRLEHIWISDSLVRHVFRTYSSKRIKPSTTRLSSFSCSAAKFRRSGGIARELHTASAKWSARLQSPKGLFSWSSEWKSKTPSLFDKKLPPWKDPNSVDGVKDRDILKTLAPPGDRTLSEDIPPKKDVPLIIGFDDGPDKPVPKPFLRNFHNRLDHLIEHGTQLPSSKVEQKRDAETAAKRSRLISHQIGEIFVGILPRLYGADKAQEMLVGQELQVDRTPLQLVPYLVPPLALVSEPRSENSVMNDSAQETSAETSDVQQPILPLMVNLGTSELEKDISSSSMAHPTPMAHVSTIAIEDQADHPTEMVDIPPMRESDDAVSEILSASERTRQRRTATKRMFKLSPSLSNIEGTLETVLTDPSVPLHTLFLIHSQINAIYDIRNMRGLEGYMRRLKERLSTGGLYYSMLLPRHPAMKVFAEITPLNEEVVEDASTFEHPKTMFIFGSKEFDSPLRSIQDKFLTSKSICLVWKQVKRRSRVPDELFRKTKRPALPVSAAMLVLEQGIKIINRPGWDLGMAEVADVIIDIFHHYRKEEKTLSFLFTYLVEFMRAWQMKWGTKEYIDTSKHIQYHTPKKTIHQRVRKQAPPQVSPKKHVPKSEKVDRYKILGLDKLLNSMPSEFADRLITTLLLQPRSKPSRYDIPFTNEDWQLHRIQPLAPWCRGCLSHQSQGMKYRGQKPLVEIDSLEDIAFLEDPTALFKTIMAHRTHEEIAQYLKSATDYKITEFHLRNLTTRLGPNHKFNDLEVFHNDQRRTIQGICIDVKENLARHDQAAPRYQPGLPFAQAIMSLFYYRKLPLQKFVEDLLRTLAILGRTNSLKSCINILCESHERKVNGLVFRVPKSAIEIGLECLYMEDPLWALGILQSGHHIPEDTWKLVLLHTAKTHPQQTQALVQEYLRKLEVKSSPSPTDTTVPTAPTITFVTDEKTPLPPADFLVKLAKVYALSDAHSANSATRKIRHIRYFMRKHGYETDIRIARALVAVAMIKTAAHRLWTGPPLASMKELFEHGRIEFAIVTFMQDAEQDPVYLKGLNRPDRFKKKREFVERCMAEVWEEIDTFQRTKYLEGVKRNSMFTSVI
ncbi:hypothetical protein AA313_de0200630 [Arthrobotrys entomopaga]|nr:hypothetical protein AA313_de0200630 [Arthrobotrys entomopaga]